MENLKIGDWVEACRMLPGILVSLNNDDAGIVFPDLVMKNNSGTVSSCSVKHCGVHKITPEYANILFQLGEDKLKELWRNLSEGSSWEDTVTDYYNKEFKGIELIKHK